MNNLIVRPASKQELVKSIKDLGSSALTRRESTLKREVNELLQVVIVFDTTGSMYRYLQVVQGNLVELIARIKERVSAVEFSVVVYGDHCDANTTYVTKVCQFTDDAKMVQGFIAGVEKTGGGDEPEALEDALREVNNLNWKERTKRCIVLVGDAPPHGVMDGFEACSAGIDYREETKKLARQKAKIYSVLCNRGQSAEQVFRWLAEQTEGKFLRLENMNDLIDLIVGVCIKESGGNVDDFIRDLGKLKQLTTSKEKVLRMLTAG